MAQLIGTFGLYNYVEIEEDWESVKGKIKDMKSSTGEDDGHPFVVNQVATENDLLVHLKGTNCKRW